jgi:hypothetical protein
VGDGTTSDIIKKHVGNMGNQGEKKHLIKILWMYTDL